MKSKDYVKSAVQFDMPNKDYTEPIEFCEYNNNINSAFVKNPNVIRLVHASLGMSGEVGEVVDHIKKLLMYQKQLDKEKVLEEIGDVLWYMAIMIDELGSSFDDIMEMNIQKLSKRYANGFTKEDAIARKDKK